MIIIVWDWLLFIVYAAMCPRQLHLFSVNIGMMDMSGKNDGVDNFWFMMYKVSELRLVDVDGWVADSHLMCFNMHQLTWQKPQTTVGKIVLMQTTIV